MKKLRFSPDYFCSPIWHADGEITGEFGPIDPDTLPISHDLASEINAWAQWFDKGLNMDDPGNSEGMGIEEMQRFISKGNELFARLSQELGTGYTIEYRPFWRK